MNDEYKTDSAYRYRVSGGNLAFEDPTYVERQADKNLDDAIVAGEYCYVLNARQMGKSSLRVHETGKLKDKNIICLTIDLQGIEKNIDQNKFYFSIAYKLLKPLNEFVDINLNDWWSKHKNLSYNGRLTELFESEIFSKISDKRNIVIFIDEIERIIHSKYQDDFLGFIRHCFQRRTEEKDYKRLTFVLLGAVTPFELIENKTQMPYNIGIRIELHPFTWEETLKLKEGLKDVASNPDDVLREIWNWTGGQPYLTQKVCQIVVDSKSFIQKGNEKNSVEKLVQLRLIKDWKDQDDLDHLKTRSIRLSESKSEVIELYKEILEQGEVAADDSPEQSELFISGLVVKQDGKLKVANRIYPIIFNIDYVREVLAKKSRPYAEQLNAWLASERLDQSKLLYGQKLKDAEKWKVGKNLTAEDYEFLSASQVFDERSKDYLSNISNYEAVIEAVLSWTGGQKELNDTIFQILQSSSSLPKEGSEAEWVDNLVRSQMIDNWEAQEAAKPLREIRDRLLENQECDRFRLLESYRQILLQEGVAEDSSREQRELLELRLVVSEQGLLKGSNRIYKEVFNHSWVKKTVTDSLVGYTGGELETLSEQDKTHILEVLQKWLPQLVEKTKSRYSIVIEEILLWTKPNPFLIKTLCKLICESNIRANNEAEHIKQLVQTHFIGNWEVQKPAKPLRDIRDRLLENQEHDSFWRLMVYRQILRQERVVEDCSREKEELLKLKLVNNINGKLSVFNRTYQVVFNQIWVDQALAGSSRPYAKELTAWLDSKCKDKSKLLVGENLQKATAWADDNKDFLKKQERQFLSTSVIEKS